MKCFKNHRVQECFPKLQIITLRGCGKLNCVFPTIVGSNLPNLIRLRIENCDNLEEIFAENGELQKPHRVQECFPKLQDITLRGCGKLNCVFPTIVGSNLPNLIALRIGNCENLEEIFVENGELQKPHRVQECFSNLQAITLRGCGKLNCVFPTIVGSNLPNLTRLRIENCDNLEEIVAENGELQKPHRVQECFPKLQDITLRGCGKLNCVFPTIVDSNLPNLKYLCIENCENLEEIFAKNGELQKPHRVQECFPKLQDISLRGCGKLNRVFPTIVGRNLPNLTRLRIENCDNLEEIFAENGELQKPHRVQECFPKLQDITLRGCGKLNCVFPTIVGSNLPNLIGLRIENCDNLEEIFAENGELQKPHRVQECFSNLQAITLRGCGKLNCVFPTIVGSNLPNLTRLRIENCENLEEIFAENGELQKPHRVQECFPKLQDITLRGCGKLNWVFPTIVDSNLPNLKYLCIENCENLEEIFAENGELQKPHGVQECFQKLEDITLCGCGKLNCVFPTIIDSNLPNLTYLCIENCENLEEIFAENGELQKPHRVQECFPKLQDITLRGCGKLNCVFPTIVGSNLPNLIALRIGNCENLEEIFAENGELQKPHRVQECFPKLQAITLRGCGKLNCVFPTIVGSNLPNLTRLRIENCDNLEEIFAENGELQKPHRVQECFQKLEDITLCGCGKLNCVFPTIIDSNLPNLTYLCIEDCENLEEIFAENGELQKPHRVQECFPNLFSITLRGCGKLKRAFPTIIDSNFPHLHCLTIGNCENLEEIFAENGELQNPWFQECFQVLEQLYVHECPKLKFIFPVRMARYFPQLNSLYISGDSELKEIFRSTNENISNNEKKISAPNLTDITFEKLPSLVDICQGFDFLPNELVRVQIQDCPKFSVISKAVRGWRTKGARVFLVMDGNPLRSNEDPTLPLTYVLSEEFGSCGVIDIFQIKGSVNVGEDDQHQLTGSKAMRLGPEHELWRGPIPKTMVSFQYLQHLTVRRCGKLKYLLPVDAIHDSLPELFSLKIGDCNELEQVIAEENADLQRNGSTTKVATECFPKLQAIEVERCEELMRFFPTTINSKDKIVLPNLTELTLLDLPKLVGLEDQVHIPRCDHPWVQRCPNSRFPED
ncbi:uncharacterized protein LOC129318649 isoform X1 [Prosopis cineraria]|uniref:uncharacterized protein LOC129318649 isoform X1 n=1 Tax=Prosopis cineraria TaxID=364024 RepID=UPI00240F3EFE|nr:uncharacterized protein LOC129318649 isoform X1 [Prosopis cineraria]